MKTLGIIIGLMLAVQPLYAADSTIIYIGWDGYRFQFPDSGRQIGLALSGGGARGIAQIGVIKALEESGLKISAIAGTSIGGIIGGLYASGYDADSLKKIFLNINFPSLFRDRPSRTSLLTTQRSEKERYLLSIRFDGFVPHIPQALTAGQRLTDLISSLTLQSNYISGTDFSRMRVPFRAVTTDIVSGKETVIGKGNLADAIRATMAFPLAFTGVEKEDMILMDGGLVNPIPVDVVRALGSKFVVAVNTTSDLLPKNKIRDPIDIADQVTTIMSLDEKESGLKQADWVITPAIAGIYSSDFQSAAELIDSGYQAGWRAAPEIIKRLQLTCDRDTVCLESIVQTGMPDSLFSAVFPLKDGAIVRRTDIAAALSDLYRSQLLFSVNAVVSETGFKFGSYNIVNLRMQTVPRPAVDSLQIICRGNTVFDSSVIAALLTEGRKTVSSEDIENFARTLESLYRKRGHDLAHLRSVRLDPEHKTIIIDVDEGLIEKIEVTGRERTKKWLVSANFPLREGEPFRSTRASAGITNIYATGLFERVSMFLTPGDSGAVVTLNVAEKKYTQARFGWRWDDEYRSEEFAEVLDDNLFGTGQEILLHARYAPRRQRYELSLKADRFFSTYLTYRARGYYGLLERKLYDERGKSSRRVLEKRYGFEFLLGQQIARLGTVTGEIKWEQVKNRFRPGGSEEEIRLRAITIRSLVETFNRRSFPTAGKKHQFFIEYAADILGGETEYTKVFSSLESYFPLSRHLNFHPRFAVGWMQTDYKIPLSEKFYLGGAYSFIGFKTDELAGDKMILANLELRYRLPYRFYITAKYDLGEIYRSIDDIKLDNLRYGYGASLAFDSPIGPVDFTYGKAKDRTDRYYLNIGFNF